MATVLVLQHPDETPALPSLRLILLGSSLVTDVKGMGWSAQRFPSPSEATLHLERVLRLRKDEGYSLREGAALTDSEAALFADPLAAFVRHHPERGRMNVDFEEGPLSPETCAEIVDRLAAVGPPCIEYLRGREIPGGLLGAALAGKSLPSVKALIFDTVWFPAPRPEDTPDDLAALLAAFPNLERIAAKGLFTLREANHGCLRELHLEGEPLLPATLAAIGAGSLPALATLDLSLGKKHALDRVAAIALRSLAAPRLRTIRVAEITDLTRFLGELTEHPLPASWATLHANGSVGDEDELLAVLRERAPALRSLATLGLPLANELSQGGAAEAKTILPSIMELGELPDLLSPTAPNDW